MSATNLRTRLPPGLRRAGLERADSLPPGLGLEKRAASNRTSETVKSTFQKYSMHEHPTQQLVIVVKTDVEVSSPRLIEEIACIRSIAGELTRNIDVRENITLDDLRERVPTAFRLAADENSGHILIRHSEKGEAADYDSELCIWDLDAVLQAVDKLRDRGDFFIKLIGSSGNSHAFLMLASNQRIHLLHRGGLIGSGAGGSVFKTWEVFRGVILANKQDTQVITVKEFEEKGSDVVREAELIRRVNPTGTVTGLQKPVRFVYQIRAADLQRGTDMQCGFISPLYDGDLVTLFSNEKLSTEQILRGISQLFHGVSALNNLTTPVAHLDIKSANIFIKRHEGFWDMCVADLDQVRVLDDAYFDACAPVPMTSPDSISSNELQWIENVGTAIAETMQLIKKLDSQSSGAGAQLRRERRAALHGRLQMLKEKYIFLIKSVHARAIAFIAYQMLLGKVVMDADDVDITMLIRKINKDESLSDEDKAKRIRIANVLQDALERTPDSPREEFSPDTEIPEPVDIDTLIQGIEQM